ncbi:MAG: SGNH/GDSL hydrolase family protein [Acidobacteriota bacterium]
MRLERAGDWSATRACRAGQRTSWNRFIALFCAIAGIVACSQSPTRPSPLGSSPTPGSAAVGPPAATPVLIGAPNAIGLTRFVALGDSITFGTLSSFNLSALVDAPAHAYPTRLQLGLNTFHAPQVFTVVNRGLPAENAAQAVQRLPGTLASDRPQALLVLHGINDLNGGASPGQTAAALNAILSVAEAQGVAVLLSTMFQTYESQGPDGSIRPNAADQVQALNVEIRRLATGRPNVHLVDLAAAFGANRSLLGGDGLHPTVQGYELMATVFLGSIRQAFPVRGSFQ